MAELRALANELQDSAAQLREAGEEHSLVKTKAADLNREFVRIEEQIKLGGLKGNFAQVLVELRRRLPNPRAIDNSLNLRAELLQEVRLASFRVEDKLLDQDEMESPLNGQDMTTMSNLVQLR